MNDFLHPTEVINFNHPLVAQRAQELSAGTVELTAKRCFEWVRDEIQHSRDYERDPVTCRASDVLQHGTGYCFAKSHLLAALLRANGIPAGFCYQRLCLNDHGPPYTLHGLNAVYLPVHGWYRVDPRGNRPGIDAQFCPPVAQLAFAAASPEERDFAEIFPEPLPCVIEPLQRSRTWSEVLVNLPDATADMMEAKINQSLNPRR